MSGLTIEPISGALGAEVSGVDLTRPLDDATVTDIRQALLDHLVIFFRDQAIGPAEQLAFAERFGAPEEYPFVNGLDDFPLVVPILKREHETVNFGGLWHSDTSYLQNPPMATILHAKELPPYGGDTLFANMYLAYETLSDGLKAVLDGLSAVSIAGKPVASVTRADRIAESGSAADEAAHQAVHPVVRTHPETGRKALYVNVAHTLRFDGMTEEESAPLLDYLYAHQIKPEFTCRFRWSVGALAFWDNRAAQHNPINDYHGHRRLLHRIILAGDRPA
jgi:taurine dioxygenase